MTKQKLSLIVPVYNAKKDLPSLFASILYQARPFDEIILVDNNSHDGSLESCEFFKEQNRTLKIITCIEKSPGPGCARNRGIAEANGDIFCFTDSDCVLDKDFSANIESLFKTNPDMDILGGTAAKAPPFPLEHRKKTCVEEFLCVFWSHERSSEFSFPLNDKNDFFKDLPFYITTYNMACRRKVITSLKGFENIKAMEDIDFWIRACEKGFRSVAGAPDIRVYHRNRTTLAALARQYFHYVYYLPWIMKKHFKHKFYMTYKIKHIFSFRIFTGLIDINPHTLILFIAFLNFSLMPVTIVLLVLFRYFTMTWRLYKAEKKFILKAFVFSAIMEIRRIAMTAGALAGSIRYKVLCLL